MRIGKVIIDTDSMSVEEITILINELREIRSRKKKVIELKERMNELLSDAAKEGFDFIEKDFGYCLRIEDIDVWDNK